ncbi:MAG TPA: hypothetical protein ENK18_22110 [Deltaproteobacteria bacterium]|nr:hypothetical protein [Deltaproteobacteria bacterium]
MAKTATFLQLSPEFGGTRFGPFDVVEIRLGSDPEQSDITLPETLGVIPQHVLLLRQQDASFILAPIDRAAPIYHFRSGKGAPRLVTAPVAIRDGDAFALVTPEGPRFHLVVEKDAKAIAEAARESQGPAWGVNLDGSRFQRGLIEEIRRRGVAAVVTTSVGHTVVRASAMIRTGQIFRPIYVVSGMMMLSGWLFAGTAACGALSFNKQKSSVVQDLSTCQDRLGVVLNDAGDAIGDPTVPDLVSRVLAEPVWKNTLRDDTELMTGYREQLKAVLAQQSKYTWVYTRKASPYTRLKSELDGLPEALVRVLAFAAVGPSYDREWSLINDSESEEVCGRGPLGLTYRQATNLGLVAQPDALVDRQLAESGNIEEQRLALDRTLRNAGAEHEYRDDLISSQGAEIQGGMQCLYIDGDDERTNIKRIADALRRKLGVRSGVKAPKQDELYWLSSRLLLLYAQDFKSISLEGLSFNAKAAPTLQMSNLEIKDSRRSFAVRSAARLMARATAIPCFARFDKEEDSVPEWFLAQPPMLGNCAILKAYVEYNRL